MVTQTFSRLFPLLHKDESMEPEGVVEAVSRSINRSVSNI